MSKANVDEDYINQLDQKLNAEINKTFSNSYKSIKSTLSVSKGEHIHALKNYLEQEEAMVLEIKAMQLEIMDFLKKVARGMNQLDERYSKQSK